MRSAEFDREYVLRSAMNEFIAKGYNKTSMQDLKRATGLHPGSIYCAFENKRGLLLASLNHYAETKSQSFEAFFVKGEGILKGFELYLNDIVELKECYENKGCLLQKSLSELEQQDDEVEQIICDMLNQWKTNIKYKLDIAKANGEIQQDTDCELLSDFLVMNIYGLRSFATTKPSKECLEKLVKKIIQSLKNS
ncbi:TetR/AcrR family transcriptional regulator [Vibrio ziniensis]|uniref:TetR/AcrR family transcriptional regulator n=1 Tax=Vibrio ziniensis TaxID=2711221 RepID=A0A6G7CQ83_9VIBR|nr:TetR/AcrR family transcriptional regulator [Vibrio ziniensis]QIH44250.1 TetR/AcrR family transcriptional regulator [Vibrio ziniensis]